MRVQSALHVRLVKPRKQVDAIFVLSVRMHCKLDQMRPWPLFLLLACFGCGQPAQDGRRQEAPLARAPIVLPARPDGPVSDGANLISPADEEILDTRLREIFERTRTALIVVTVPSLGDRDVDAYTNALARQWKVGGERGGVVLLLAPTERQMRIETSDDVRVRLSDRQCLEIIQRVLTPQFKTGDFAGGITAGVEAIASHL